MIPRILSRLRRDESGFSLIEAVISMGVIFTSLVLLAGVTASAGRDVAFARQRQGANQIANQLLEEVRGLAYDTMKRGHLTSQVASDPNVVNCAGTRYYKACPASDPTAEKVVHATGLPPVSPLVPHTGTYGPPLYPSTYSWSVYLTEAIGVPESGAYRARAIVSWTNTQRQGLRDFVEAQTLIFSPEGCTSPSTHPFAAPCEVFFRGFGGVDPATVVTTGTVDGVAFDSFVTHLASARADVQVEQVTMVTGHVQLPGGEKIANGETSQAGVTADGAAADNDPSTPAGSYDSVTVGPQAVDLVSASGSGRELRTNVNGGDDGSSIATTAASASNPCNLQVDGRSCAHSTARHGGAVNHRLVTGSGSGTANLVSVGTQTNPSTIYGRRLVPGSGGDGLVREITTRRIPTLSLGGLPSGIPAPDGWAGYWVRLASYTATARAEAGLGTVAPTATISNGNVLVWNGTDYTTVPVTADGVEELDLTPLSYTATNTQGHTVTVEISGSLSIEPSTISETVVTGSERSAGEAVLGSPVSGTITYEVSRNGVPEATLLLEVDLGTAYARAAYERAPGS